MTDHSVSAHIYLRKLKGGPAWYLKARMYPSLRERRLRLGPAWQAKSAPPEGYLTKRSAEAARDEWLVAERSNLSLRASNVNNTCVTFQAACDEWLRWTEQERGAGSSTMTDYRRAVKSVLVEEFGAEVPLKAIVAADVEAFKQQRLGRLAPRTINKYLVMLNGIFARALWLGWLDENPCARVARLPQRRSNRFAHLEPAEVEAVARAAAGDLERALYVTAAFTGLRQGELKQLRWEDIAFANALVHVRHQTKSHLVRSVPMIDRVARELDAWSQATDYGDPADLVFPNPVGNPFDGSKVTKEFQAALVRAKLAKVRFHDLRHTFGTLAVRSFPLTDVKVWMGHADIQTTMIYVHSVPQHDAAAKLGAAMAVDTVETQDAARV